ncbi:MAG: SCP2 sterol-binding domain-containing protein [Halobacteria archaeon]|nr:SCP2 sterol-binding domain-containing protein [Halobacteria archaeon]
MEWFEEYGRRLNRNDEFAELASDWGEDFDGDFVFHVRRVPIDSRNLSDLPDDLLEVRKMPEEVWEDIPDGIEEQIKSQTGNEPVYRMASLIDDDVRQRLPEYLRDLIDEVEELFDEERYLPGHNPTYADVPEFLSDEMRSILPDHLDRLLYQLEEFVDEDGNVYAYLSIEDGKVTEIDVFSDPEKRDAGFVVSGPYRAWEDLVARGDIVEMVMEGELEVRGDMARVLEYVDAMQIMGETAREVETRYLF